MFRKAATKEFPDTAEMVGLCDANEGRLRSACERGLEDGVDVPGYAAADFERMVRETRPDCVIVTVRDRDHDDYICRALRLGCDVITEKPMTIDAERCARILKTQRETGRHVMVTFNYRYSPPRTQIKDMLMSGVIGEVLSLDFHWMLDLHHGADYFRRWHRRKENSGGLMVHKATHHFDLINWWLSTVPEEVFARGHRRFYTPETAERYGLTRRAERCHGCPESKRCKFFINMAANENLRRTYLDCESFDGYFRDRCVFGESIDIEDSMEVLVAYRSGAKMSYSLNAFSPWEGYVVSINGTRGRLENKCEETVYINADGSVPGALKKEGNWIRVYPHWEPAYEVDVWRAEGGHGGADPVMLKTIFDPASQPEDKYLRAADQRAGAWSILTGVAANLSMRDGGVVRVPDLVPDLALPDYPPMPSADEPLDFGPEKSEG